MGRWTIAHAASILNNSGPQPAVVFDKNDCLIIPVDNAKPRALGR